MFSLIGNLTKALVSVALTPASVIADVLTLPASAEDPKRGPFDRTEYLLNNAGECVKKAIKPN
jgi:hypothetical protein